MQDIKIDDILSQYGGSTANCLNTVFSNIEEDETIDSSPICQHSAYLDPSSVENFLRTNSDRFSIFSMNVDSLHKKHPHISIFVEELLQKNLFFSALTFQETRITKDTDCTTLNIPNYELIPMPQVCSKKGGLVTYVHNSFTGTARPDLYKKSKIWEGQFIDISGPSLNESILIANIYRPPLTNKHKERTISRFTKEFKPILTKLKKENRYKFLCGDYNML